MSRKNVAGTHPNVIGETINRTVCFNTYCELHLDVQIRNCGGFYLYFLSDTSLLSPSCEFRYCSD